MASQGVAMPPNKRRDGKGAKSWGKNIKVLLSGRGTIMTSKFWFIVPQIHVSRETRLLSADCLSLNGSGLFHPSYNIDCL